MNIKNFIKNLFKNKNNNNNKERIFPYLSDDELKECNDYMNSFEKSKLTAEDLKILHKMKSKKVVYDNVIDYPYDDSV